MSRLTALSLSDILLRGPIDIELEACPATGPRRGSELSILLLKLPQLLKPDQYNTSGKYNTTLNTEARALLAAVERGYTLNTPESLGTYSAT